MYNFRDTKVTNEIDTFNPSDNLRLNGVGINGLVDGYRQLSVSGRGVVSRRVDTTDVPARGGVWYGGAVDVEREITVKYLLEAQSSAELRLRFEKLNDVLRKTNADGYLNVTFADEPDYTYLAVLKEASDVVEDSLNLMSEFVLLCPSPTKKGRLMNSLGRITLSSDRAVLPTKIILSVTGTVDTVEVINGTKKLVLKGSYKAGDVITFDFKPDDFEIFLGSRLILHDLQLYSPLEDFWLRNGDTVTAKNATVTKIEWRDERL